MIRDDHHEALAREDEVSGSSDRGFGLTFAAIAGVVGGTRMLLGHPHGEWWLGAGVVFLLVALVRPTLLAPLNRLWLRLGLVLYRVVNPVVMALLFFTTVLPIALLMRLAGKDPLRLRPEPGAASYWIVREPPGPAPETMAQQF